MANVPQWPAASHACNHVLSLADGHGDQRVTLIGNKTEEYFKSFSPGYRFCPTDIELIVHYLNKKIKNEKLPPNEIHEVNLYRYSPEHISGIYPAVLGKLEWYFFTPRDRKYANGTRPNRAAGTGYWKATGADKKIRDHKRCTIGYRKTLVFYEGKPPKGEKTSWIMHEYRADAQPRQKSCATDMRLDDYVLCRIYKKDKSSKKQKNLLPTQPIVQSQNAEENHSKAQNDSHEALDDMDNHVEEVYKDYPQPISLEEVQGISQSGGDNIFLSFDDYGLEHKGLANPIGNKWPDMNPKDYQFVQTDFVNPIEDQWNINTNVMSQPQLLRSLPVPTSTPTSVPVLPMTNVPYLNYLDYLRWEEQEIQKHDFMNQIRFSEQVENLDEVIGTSLTSFDCPPPPPKRKKRF